MSILNPDEDLARCLIGDVVKCRVFRSNSSNWIPELRFIPNDRLSQMATDAIRNMYVDDFTYPLIYNVLIPFFSIPFRHRCQLYSAGTVYSTNHMGIVAKKQIDTEVTRCDYAFGYMYQGSGYAPREFEAIFIQFKEGYKLEVPGLSGR